MATATITMREVVTLGLSIGEAQALRAVLQRVGGHPEYSRRGLTDSINDALRRIDIMADTQDMAGSLTFGGIRL